MTRLLHPIGSTEIPILNVLQRKFVNEGDGHSFKENKIDWAQLKRYKEQDDTFPERVTFSWETNEKESTVEIAEKQDFF